ncbi:MAG: hypothetical protein DRI95_06000 [Bacteroidetes bacterium]|nr:MAG: hypothetical protein DRI95_06000 [Bacteroidota bacterium]
MIKRINQTDLIVLLFIFISGLIIIFGRIKTEYFPILIGARIVALLIIFVLLKLDANGNNKIISFLRYFYPLIFTAYFYGETGYYNNIFFNDLDGIFVQIEDVIFGFQPSLWFSSEYKSIWFNEFMSFSYFSFYLLIIIFPIILFFKKNHEFDKYFFIIIFSAYSYYLFFVLFPVVGPQFYFPEEQAETVHPFFWSKLMKLIQDIGETPTGAFPSSHVGLSWIILLISIKTYKKLLIVIFPLALLICFSTIYIRAHYVVDIIGGLISAPLLYFMGNKIYVYYNKKLQYVLID